MKYRKTPNISPGLILVRKPFLWAYIRGGAYIRGRGGANTWNNICVKANIVIFFFVQRAQQFFSEICKKIIALLSKMVKTL